MRGLTNPNLCDKITEKEQDADLNTDLNKINVDLDLVSFQENAMTRGRQE